ncbi:MAG: hypothetical protein IKI50_07110 [Clostridia bacterium]|nr:hypothetical protein [Clostridia bacterium]
MNRFDNISILSFGAAADGSADISAAVTAGAAELGDEQALFFPNGTYLVGQDLTIDCPVKLSGNVSIRVAAGKTLTINGLFGAAIQSIFSGEGAVRFTNASVWGYPQWFAADIETTVTTELFQKAIDSLRCVYLQNNTYTFAELNITRPISIKGIGARRIRVNAERGIGHLFNIQSDDVSIEGLNIKMDNAPDAVCFYFNTQNRNLKNISILSCAVAEGITSLTDADSDAYTVSDVLLSAVDFTNVRGTAVYMHDFVGNIKMVEVAIHRRQYNNAKYNMGVPGAIFENADGLTLEHFDVNGEANIVNGVQKKWVADNIGGHGAVFRHCKNVRIIRALMEYLAGTGWVIEDCEKFYMENVESYTFHGRGFDIDGLKDSEIRVVKACVAGGDTDRSEENFRFCNCSDLLIVGIITNGSRDAAVSLQGCRKVTVDAMSIFEKSDRSIGLQDLGGNADVVINGLIDSGNANTAVELTGTGITIRDALLKSGTYQELSQAGKY